MGKCKDQSSGQNDEKVTAGFQRLTKTNIFLTNFPKGEFFVNLTSFIIFVLSHLVAKEEQLSCRWVGMHACR